MESLDTMPWFTYHSGHSGQFCRHAENSLEDIVQCAIARGFTHYGLSEHSPRYEEVDLFPEEVDGGVAGLHRLFDEYVVEARRLQEAYADRIELLVGFETEKLPRDNWADTMRGLRERHGFDYIVGSVHDLEGRWVDFSEEITAELASACGGVVEMQKLYFDSLCELIVTLRPEVVGHVDLIRKFDGMDVELDPALSSHVERALEATRSVDARLDVNAGAHRHGLSPVYPLPTILKRAREMGVGVTLGDDAHGVASVGDGLDVCVGKIADAGYRQIDFLTKRSGEVVWESAEISSVKPIR